MKPPSSHKVPRVSPILALNASLLAQAPDGVTEAFEISDQSFNLCVQWHPELLDSPPQKAIYQALVTHAANFAERNFQT